MPDKTIELPELVKETLAAQLTEALKDEDLTPDQLKEVEHISTLMLKHSARPTYVNIFGIQLPETFEVGHKLENPDQLQTILGSIINDDLVRGHPILINGILANDAFGLGARR